METQDPETTITELAEILIEVTARQAAILKMIRSHGVVSSEQMEDYQTDASRRIRNLPAVQEVLAKKHLPRPGSLAKALTGFHWDS